MDPIALDIRLIRSLLAPGVKIVPGRVLMARVVSTGPAGRGALSIAGAVLEAELPAKVKAGDELRLTVRHVEPDRVVLSLSDQPAAVPAAAVQLPGGGAVRIVQEEGSPSGSASPESHILSLRYDAPTLGPVDLRFELDPRSLQLTVTTTPGASLERAQENRPALRDALANALNRSIAVTVGPRREPLDVYA